MRFIDPEDPIAVALLSAIHTGDVPELQRRLAEDPTLSQARIGKRDGASRTLLHIVADWPGHVPAGAASVKALVEAGADVNARFIGTSKETPLHWAASCDDVDVLDALIDAGADLEAPGAVIAGGTPLTDATAFAQWAAAKRLVARGARTTITDEAALGVLDRLEARFAGAQPPGTNDINAAFWFACHGGQKAAAAYLLARGADVNWLPPWEPMTPLDASVRSGFGEISAWLLSHGARHA